MPEQRAASASRRPLALPTSSSPRPGALSLLTPAQRGLALAIMQADRCGRGGEDLNILGGTAYGNDGTAAAQLNQRINMVNQSIRPDPTGEQRKAAPRA